MTNTIHINDEVSPEVRRIAGSLKDRRPLLRLIGNRVKNTTRDHLIKRSQTIRNPYGAPSSGFWGQAAEKVANTPLDVQSDSVSLSLNHPGIARAFGPVTIRPTTGVYLTIPLIAQAYNRRAYRVPGLFFVKTKKGKVFLADKEGDRLKFWYSLVPVVHQKQDRSILPSDAQMEAAVIHGANDYLNALLAQKGAQQ